MAVSRNIRRRLERLEEVSEVDDRLKRRIKARAYIKKMVDMLLRGEPLPEPEEPIEWSDAKGNADLRNLTKENRDRLRGMLERRIKGPCQQKLDQTFTKMGEILAAEEDISDEDRAAAREWFAGGGSPAD